MHVSEFSVKRPVTILVFYILAIGIAATMLPNLNFDLFPSVIRPVFTVVTRFPGAGPADVERNVTEPLERALASSSGLVNMVSNSNFQASFITLTFEYGTDMDKAVADAQVLLNRLANSLPDGVQSPIIRRFGMEPVPIMRLVLRGNHPPDQLRVFAEDEIQSAIERIEGVAAADVTGGTTQLVNVEVSLNRLAAHNLTLNDVSNALRGQNVLVSGGSLRRGTREYQIMTQEELTNIDQIRRIVVKTVSGSAEHGNRTQVIRLEDIAEVSLGHNDNAARITVNGQTGVYVQVTAESEANQMRVADNVRAVLGDINASLPQGITLEVLTDNTTMIRSTLNQVYRNALQGIMLGMIVLFLFLRNGKGTMIIGLAIPISMLLTLMTMSVFGFSLNLLTMTGLIMGMGMTTDASIVILENIYSYRERGTKPSVAAILGTREMMRAIMTSTVTTICVFIPMIIFRNDLGEMGLMFNDLIFTVIISLTISLIVAITLVPALAGPVMKLHTRSQQPLRFSPLRFIDNKLETFLKFTESKYKGALDYCLSHRAIILILVLFILVFSLMQFGDIGMNMFVRMRTDDNVSINVALPRGTAIDVTEAILFDIEEIVRREVRGYRNIILTARRAGMNQGTVQITLPPPTEQIDTPAMIIRRLTPILNEIPGARIGFRAGMGMGSTSAVEIAISSRNNDAILATAEDIMHIMVNHLPEIENPAISVDEGAPQLQIEIDRDRAASFGISVAAIASEIRTAMDGNVVTTMSRGDRLLDVQVRLQEEDRTGLPNLDAIFVMGRGGTPVALSNVASITEGRAPSSIRRERQQRVVRVTGDLAPGIAVTDFQRHLESTIDYYLIPREGVSIAFLGEAHEIQAASRRYLFIIALAIFLILGVMASQFESFVDPLIIFFSIPLLFIGVIWIYRLTGQAMTMFSIVGVVACIGVVVNAGIVLVDYTNTLRERGLGVREACIEAGRRRLRPILMTSFTTILSMTPIAFFPGVGADAIQPIGKTFVGGLAVSTIMTLFVIPIMYSVLNQRQVKAKTVKETVPANVVPNMVEAPLAMARTIEATLATSILVDDKG